MKLAEPMVALLAAMLLMAAPVQAAVTLSPNVDVSSLAPGDNFVVDVNSDEDQVAGLTLNLTYNASAISYRGATFNPGFNLTVPRSEPSNASGTTVI